MIEDNKDLFPNPEDVASCPMASPVIENQVTREAFAFYETQSNSARDTYRRWSRISILMIAIPALFTVFEALILPHIGPKFIVNAIHFLSMFGSLAAFIGICVQAWLYFKKIKIKWIMNRFAAERIRSIHFQAFALGGLSTSTTDFKERVEVFSRNAMAALRVEINGGHPVLQRFSPEQAIEKMANTDAAHTSHATDSAAAYEILRIRYQRSFAISEESRPDRGNRFKQFFSDNIYFAGLVSVFTTLFLKMFADDLKMGIAISEFFVVLTLWVGFVERLFEQTTIRRETSLRFKNYADAIESAAAEKGSANKMRKMEHAALSELNNFCRDIDDIKLRL